jgi:lipoic acid synthetase
MTTAYEAADTVVNTENAVQTLIPTVSVATPERAARPKVEAGVKLRGAEKVARIPVKIIPTVDLPKKPDWIRVRSISCTASAKRLPARTWANASPAALRRS